MDDVFELREVEEDMYDRLTDRIPYAEVIFGTKKNYQTILEDIIIASRNKALSLIYPFDDYSVKEVPTKYLNWQYRCCIELYNLSDKIGFSSYSENGESFGKLTDGLSKDLITEITSKVGIPLSEDDE